MHYHLEIVMPPTDNVEAAVGSIMAPFDENPEGEEERHPHAFWDYWSVGGRWSGAKLLARLGSKRVDGFREELNRREITVSGIRCGKPDLSPMSQKTDVDALWREWFPDSGIEHCPFFGYAGETLSGDVCSLSETPRTLRCGHVIFASRSFESKTKDWAGPFDARDMIQTDMWNGVSWVDTVWDGTIGSALLWHEKKLEGYAEKAQLAFTPTTDWLVVTVDYHS